MSQVKAKWILKDVQTLEDDGLGNLRVKMAPTGALESGANGITIKTGGVSDAMLAGAIPDSKLSSTFIKADGTNNFTANQSMGGHLLTNVGAPVNPTDAATKAYVDSVASGLDFQPDVLAVQTDGNLVPSTNIGDRYVITDTATMNAAFGTILGVGNGDIVAYDGTKFSVVYDVSVLGEGALAWNRAANAFVLYSQSSWASFGGISGGSTTAGSGLLDTAGVFSVDVDATTIEVSGTNKVRIKDGGVSTAKLAPTSVTAAKLGSDVVGNGLSGGNGSAIVVNGDGTSIAVGATVSVKDAGITATKLAASVAGNGLTGGAGSALSVVAGNGIAVSASVSLGSLSSADWNVGGTHTITNLPAPTANSDVATKNYVDTAISGLNGVKVETFTLSAGDITNGYVTLTAAPVVAASTILTVKGAPSQFYGDDYTIVSSNRVSWAALGLAGNLAAGDKLTVQYSS